MNEKEIIRKAMEVKRYSQKKLAEALLNDENATQSVVGEQLRRKNAVRTDKFVEMLEVMGYEVIVRDKMTKQEWKLDFE